MKNIGRRHVLSGFTALAAVPLAQPAQSKASGSRANEAIIRELYRLAEGPSLNADRFASLFAGDGYFLDVSSGQRWIGRNIRQPVIGLISAYPDIHRELLSVYATDNDVVVVELKLQGTHKGTLPLPSGNLLATGKTFDVPCCDVWHLAAGKVRSFHCYNNLVSFLRG